MPSASTPKRPLTTTLTLAALWITFYASFTLFRPALLDDADSVHAEVAREMLLRHDWVTLYANGIRYLEKAPLLYWSMAASFKLFGVSAAAARIPLAFTVLALAFTVEAFARRAFHNARAGLYAALILLSAPGIFLFTRITLPDAMVCLWLTLAMLAFWVTESAVPASHFESPALNLPCYAFAICCALGMLTKGLIGVVFPIAIVAFYLLLTRGLRGTIVRIFELHPFSGTVVFLAVAAPWHVLATWRNPTRGFPGDLAFVHGHWFVPLPTQGNVHGWAWFYFINEQVLRYLNLRVPRDYDTVPLWLFWGLILVWLMPWSAFLFKAFAPILGLFRRRIRILTNRHLTSPQKRQRIFLFGKFDEHKSRCWLFFGVWAALPLIFFSFSTRQEYYVLPALPAISILIAGWLGLDARADWVCVTSKAKNIRHANLRATATIVAFGAIFAAVSIYLLLNTHTPAPSTDLAALLHQNPSDYALSMGHFLDLNAQALSLFRLPLALAAASLFLGPFASYLLRRRAQPHPATLALAAGAFGFLLAAHLALQTFAPVLSSQQLAAAIAPQVHPDDLIVIHQEYEYASTLGFYLRRPNYTQQHGSLIAVNPIHILTDASYNGVADYGRSSNLWYGSFFPDAPRLFETPQSLAAKWHGPQRIFLWQDLSGQPSPLPPSLAPVYVLAQSGGKEIVSNQPNQP
jgi:4-amino-4-deoxy-L-arabinose transferase-like glycosyltransferase